MKIVFLDNGCDPRTIGGIQTFARSLGKMFPRELIFFLKSKKRKHAAYKLDNPTHFYLKRNIKSILLDILTNKKHRATLIKKEFSKLDKDVVVLSSPREIAMVESSTKNILVQHQYCEGLWQREDYFNRQEQLKSQCINKLDYFVALSPYDAKDAERVLGIPEEKIRVIRHTTEAAIRQTVKKPSKDLIMVCRLDNKHKRIDLAITAMGKLLDYKLHIYGSGADEDFLKELCSRLKLDNVFFYGPTTNVIDALDKSAIYIMLSDYEGYPISNIEAMRRGLPIILRNTFTAAQDIINGNGVLLPKLWDENEFVSAVHFVYDNYYQLSEQSKLLSQRHNFDKIKNDWVELIYN